MTGSKSDLFPNSRGVDAEKNQKRVLVTGASGFVGGHLVERLIKEGFIVRALVRSPASAHLIKSLGAELVQGDLTNRKSIESAASDCCEVYHLGAFVKDWGPWSEFEANTISGTRNLVEVSLSVGLDRFVLLSTSVVYGDQLTPRERVVSETMPLTEGNPDFGFYSRAKVKSEQICWQAYEKDGLPLVVLRPSWIYGPRDFTILPRLIEYFEDSRACWVGYNNPCVDPIFVTDVVDAMCRAAYFPNAIGQAYNISPVVEIGVRDFIKAMLQELNVRPPFFTVPVFFARFAAMVMEAWALRKNWSEPPLITKASVACISVDQHADSSKAVRDLGWKPKIDFKEGARQTVLWLKEHR